MRSVTEARSAPLVSIAKKWAGGEDDPAPKCCVAHAVNLRQKLERDPAEPRYLLTEPGVGYRLKD
ncbi:MAG: winged helix-turn-helix domain-containing protein [Archangium sp.]|nr:winged helix-turn-helix domain-containing protein [Archangium sp.]